MQGVRTGFCAPLNLLNEYSVAPSLSVRRPGVEGDHPHLPTNEVKSECSCTWTPSHAFKVSTRTLRLHLQERIKTDIRH